MSQILYICILIATYSPFCLLLGGLYHFLDLDVDECSLGVDLCHPAAICTNTRGSYECSCPPGSSGDGYTCIGKYKHIEITFDYRFALYLDYIIDLCNECTGVPLNCGTHNCIVTTSDCTNTIGSFQCTCRFGFAMDGVSCARKFTNSNVV